METVNSPYPSPKKKNPVGPYLGDPTGLSDPHKEQINSCALA